MNEEPSGRSTDPYQTTMIEKFFDKYFAAKYKSNEIYDNLIENYNFPYQRSKYGENFKDAVRRNISTLLNQYYTKESLIPRRNFDRKMTSEGYYLYWSLPKTSDIVLPKNVQTSFDYDAPEETTTDDTAIEESVAVEAVDDQSETTMEKDTFTEQANIPQENSQLFEDVHASDKINDPLQRIIDTYTKIDLFDIDEFQFTATKAGKKITIIISNA